MKVITQDRGGAYSADYIGKGEHLQTLGTYTSADEAERELTRAGVQPDAQRINITTLTAHLFPGEIITFEK